MNQSSPFIRVQELPARTLRWLAVGLFTLISASLWIGFAFDTYFASDGAYYFKILADKMWFTEISPSRAYAEYISQWPMVLAVNSGITDLKMLEVIFGFGLWFPWLVSFGISLYATREKPFLIFFQLISLVCLSLSAWAVMIGEHLVLLSVVWPLLFFAIIRRPLNWLERALTILLLIAHLKLYEAAMATGFVLVLLYFLRAYVSRDKADRGWAIIFAFIALGAVAIALQWTLFPRDSDNRTSFLGAMIFSLAHPYPWIGMIFVIFTGAGHFLRKTIFLKIGIYGALSYAALSLFAGGIPGGVSFSTRALTLSALPILMVLAGMYAASPIRAGRLLVKSTSGMIILIALLYLRHLQTWITFRSDFKTVLKEERGFVQPESYGEDLKHWGWTNPLLSYLWTDGTVSTVIENPRATSWQPFNPRTEMVLKKYQKERPKVLPEIEE